MTTEKTDTEKAIAAAKFLDTDWHEWLGKCIYTDDVAGGDYICTAEHEMVDLYDLINHSDATTRRDAYSIWRSQTNHELA